HELITFETTLITGRPPATFASAMQTARAATRESEEHNFVAAIDLRRARLAQIKPLASHEQSQQVAEHGPAASEPLPMSPVPDFADLPVEESDERPTTPTGRIDRWQRKLLDLSLRNRLLNFKDSKQTVPFVCPDVPLLEDRLAAGKRMRIISLKEE